MAYHVESAFEVHIYHFAEIFLFHGGDQAVAGDPCVVDQDVSRAEIFFYLGYCFLDGLKVCHIALIGQGLCAAFLAAPLAYVLSRPVAARIYDGDVGSHGSEPAGDGGPKAPAAAGDYCCLSF